ncbi:hypothetical protein DEAC_c31490 [Desulfosporosinus acididurans]|uniref:Putative Se/S carrier protein-like domain-containing protein n=1 Tax=Desulfosporosinus acididurans TaxID=476652 RepID=A0A0J1IJB8_9FIRM|nr:DUF3343 domain-containing protein [Desulfosporosinus acididurans]KLU64821.1 hypothetical protein DEAC_c31490 [Desulfosporosinus acididurans]
MTYIVLFYTNSSALKFAKFIQRLNFQGELIPLPRKLTSSCGLGVKFEFTLNLAEIISDEIEKIYAVEGNQYQLVYHAQE